MENKAKYISPLVLWTEMENENSLCASSPGGGLDGYGYDGSNSSLFN